MPEDADLSGKVAIVAVKGPRGRVRDDLSVEQKFGMSFGVLSTLGRTARNLAKVGAEAVVFVQFEDRVGLSTWATAAASGVWSGNKPCSGRIPDW